jgi:hypothetical protein
MGRAEEGRNPVSDGPFAVWNRLARNARKNENNLEITLQSCRDFHTGDSIPVLLLQETITFDFPSTFNSWKQGFSKINPIIDRRL